jgi:hypothetical protein
MLNNSNNYTFLVGRLGVYIDHLKLVNSYCCGYYRYLTYLIDCAADKACWINRLDSLSLDVRKAQTGHDLVWRARELCGFAYRIMINKV